MPNEEIFIPPVFRVTDAMDAPHGGRILRLKLETGTPLQIGKLKGAGLLAVSPLGRLCRFRVASFATIGGKVRQRRFQETGRVDLHIYEDDDTGPIELAWRVKQPERRARLKRR